MAVLQVEGGNAHQFPFGVEQAAAAGALGDGHRGLDEGRRAAAQLGHNPFGQGQFQPLGRAHGIDRLAHLEPGRFAQAGRFGRQPGGGEQTEVLVGVARFQGGRDALLAPAHRVPHPRLDHMVVGDDVAGRQHDPAAQTHRFTLSGRRP